jgi:hypothetical protein
MNSIKIYPWQQVSTDIDKILSDNQTEQSSNHNTLDKNKNVDPTTSLESNPIDDLICLDFFSAKGKLMMVDERGWPINRPIVLSDLNRIHITEEGINLILKESGYFFQWDPNIVNKTLVPLNKRKGSEKHWTTEKVAELFLYQDNLKSNNVKNHAAITADHFGISSSRLRQIKAKHKPKEQIPAFSSTYR